MTDSIGTARLDIVINTEGMEAGVERAKRSVSGMSSAAQAEYNKLNAAEKRRVDSLVRQVDTLNLTKQGQLAYNAALKTSGAVQQELLARIKATEAATKSGATALGQYGLSAKQSAAAMRGVPAQLTDIFTSLQGGQNPLTVLLQQGGQLKDMFGGVAPAARALGGALAGLINPITITAAAAGALVYALANGQKESERFNQALILTGNFAGTTAGDLALLALEMDDLAGVTTTSAASALATVAATGKFTGEQIRLVATAAEQMRDATGKAIEETVAEFEELRKDPVKAILDLNEKYHFLTQTQLDRIETLKAEGREQEAVTEAVRTYADVVANRTGEITKSLGYIERAWRGIKSAAHEAMDEILAFGRERTAVDRIRELESNISGLRAGGGVYQGISDANRDRLITKFQQEIDGLRKDAATRQAGAGGASPTGGNAAVDSAKIRDRQKAEEEFARLELSNLDKEATLERTIADIRQTGLKAGRSELEIETQVANARKRYQESLPKGRRKTGLTDEQREAQQLQRQYESLTEQMERQVALFGETSRAAAIRYDTEKGGLAGLAADQKSALVAKAEILDSLAKEKQLTEDLKRLREDIAQTELARARSNDADLLATSGVGRDEFDRIQRRLDIEQEYQDRLADLRTEEADEMSDSYRQQEAELRAHRDRDLASEAEYQQKRVALMGDWRNGANAALSDFIADNADVAGQVYGIWSGAFDGVANVISDFLATGEGDLKGFLDSLHREIMSFLVKQQLTKWLQSLGRADANSGGIMQFLGGLFQAGAGSGGWGGIAKGGAFGGGQKIEAFALGGVFDRTTPFRHGGKIGVLGEAGPEAIMPLHRGPDGKLGVRMEAANVGTASQIVNNNTTFLMPSRVTPETQSQIAMRQQQSATRSTSRNR